MASKYTDQAKNEEKPCLTCVQSKYPHGMDGPSKTRILGTRPITISLVSTSFLIKLIAFVMLLIINAFVIKPCLVRPDLVASDTLLLRLLVFQK